MKATVTKIEKRITVRKNITQGIFEYDEDNAYPQRIKNIVNASGAGTACVDMKARFIIGGGMKDTTFYKAVINREGMTVDALHRKVSKNKATLPLIGIHINYNALYEPVEAYYVPFEFIRFTTPDEKDHPNMVAVYKDWQCAEGKKVDKKKVDFIHFYNRDPEVIQQQVDEAGGWANYKGQVYIWTPEWREYPLATFDSVLEDIQSDSKTKAFKFRNITTNFMASHLLITNKFEKQDDLDTFHENIETFQGADDALKIFHIEKESDADTLELKKVEIQDVEKLYEYTESSVRDNVILNFLIPPVLLLRTSGKIGTSTEIKDATAFYNGITADDRLVIEEIFRDIFTGFAGNPNPSGDYSTIPFKAPVSENEIGADYLKYFTENEIRESKGYGPAEQKEVAKKPLYESLGVGGLQALTAILTDTTLTDDQKIASLEIVFLLPQEDAKRLVAKAAATSTTPAA